MNQEKLAKLQAQVRIGGKVSWGHVYQLHYIYDSLSVFTFYMLLLIFVCCRGQPAGRRRSCTEQLQQMTRSCSSHSRSWGSTTSQALRRYRKFFVGRQIIFLTFLLLL